MKVMVYSHRTGLRTSTGGSTNVADRWLPHLAAHWELFWYNYPKQYYKHPEKFLHFLNLVRPANFSESIQVVPMKTWEDVQAALRLPLKAGVSMFDTVSAPYVEAVFTIPLFPTSKQEVFDYAKCVYECWKVNPNLIVLEWDGDRPLMWHSVREKIFDFLKPKHLIDVTAYQEALMPIQFPIDYGIDQSRFLPVSKGSIPFGFFGTEIERTVSARTFISPIARDNWKPVIWGTWNSRDEIFGNLVDKIEFRPSCDNDKVAETINQCWSTLAMVRPIYAEIGLIPLRIFEAAEAGTLGFIDGSVKRATALYEQKFCLSDGWAMTSWLQTLEKMSDRIYEEMVSRQRQRLLQYASITSEVERLVGFADSYLKTL